MKPQFLIRYDVESQDPKVLQTFLEKVIPVHVEERVPCSLFVLGKSIEAAPKSFQAFFRDTESLGLFDIQDHSYSHIGATYELVSSVDEIRRDYEKSFELHKQMFNTMPLGVSLSGVLDKGRRQTFDERPEVLHMFAALGVRFVNAYVDGVDESKTFLTFEKLGHPEIMGFPSGHGDTAWIIRREFGDPMSYILNELAERARAGDHFPLMNHDWVAVEFDAELRYLRELIHAGKRLGYEFSSHFGCYERWLAGEAFSTDN